MQYNGQNVSSKFTSFPFKKFQLKFVCENYELAKLKDS
jgi:hypothetical protein